jgi:hypothetical protein
MNPDVSVDQTTNRPAQPPTLTPAPGIPIPIGTLPGMMGTSPAFARKPTSLPPAPQITQPLTAISLGFQMAFNQVTSPTATGNVIQGYRIYRNTTQNSFNSNASGGGSVLIRTIHHDTTHLGAVTVQDQTGASKTYFYFVTSVDTFGQESLPAAFTNGAGTATSGTVNFTSQVLLAAGQTTTSTTDTSFSPTALTNTIATHGNPVMISFFCVAGNQTNLKNTYFNLYRDSVIVGNAGCQLMGNGQQASDTVGFTFIDTPTAASHTYEVKWHVDAGPTTGNAFNLVLQTVELG